MLKVTQTEIDALEFDLDALTAEDFTDWAAAEQAVNLRIGATFLAKVITHCPWGDAHDPATYSKLPARLYLKVSQAVGRALRDEAEAEKN